MSKNPVWKIKVNDKIRHVHLMNVFEAFTVAISLLAREIKANDNIKASPKLKEKYDFYLAILKLVKEQAHNYGIVKQAQYMMNH